MPCCSFHTSIHCIILSRFCSISSGVLLGSSWTICWLYDSLASSRMVWKISHWMLLSSFFFAYPLKRQENVNNYNCYQITSYKVLLKFFSVEPFKTVLNAFWIVAPRVLFRTVQSVLLKHHFNFPLITERTWFTLRYQQSCKFDIFLLSKITMRVYCVNKLALP